MLSGSIDSARDQRLRFEQQSLEENGAARRGIRGLLAAIGFGLAVWMATAIAVVAVILT
jgi:hypothetical protein